MSAAPVPLYTVRLDRAPLAVAESQPILRSPHESARWIMGASGLDDPGLIPDDGREHFGALMLNVRHQLIGAHEISVGCLASSVVHPREVFIAAILAKAAALILYHNHPSGDPEPSGEDISLTRRLAAAGSLLGIEVLDHLVVGTGSHRFVSLKERGAL